MYSEIVIRERDYNHRKQEAFCRIYCLQDLHTWVLANSNSPIIQFNFHSNMKKKKHIWGLAGWLTVWILPPSTAWSKGACLVWLRLQRVWPSQGHSEEQAPRPDPPTHPHPLPNQLLEPRGGGRRMVVAALHTAWPTTSRHGLYCPPTAPHPPHICPSAALLSVRSQITEQFDKLKRLFRGD